MLEKKYLNKFSLLSEYVVKDGYSEKFHTAETDDFVPVDHNILDEVDEDPADGSSVEKPVPAPEVGQVDTPAPEAPTQAPEATKTPETPVAPTPELEAPVAAPEAKNNDIEKEILAKQIEFMTVMLTNVDKLSNEVNSLTDKMANFSNDYTQLKSDVQEVKEPTTQEKLEMRSLDSFPYNQKLTDVWRDDPQDEINIRGIERVSDNEYIAKAEDLDKYSDTELEDSLK